MERRTRKRGKEYVVQEACKEEEDNGRNRHGDEV
jgi:hypothetical protein